MPQIDLITYSNSAFTLTIIYLIYYGTLMIEFFPVNVSFLKITDYFLIRNFFYCSSLLIKS
jgi:hypothetical protein